MIRKARQLQGALAALCGCASVAASAAESDTALSAADTIYSFDDAGGTTHLTNIPGGPGGVLVQSPSGVFAAAGRRKGAALPAEVHGWVDDAARKTAVEPALLYAVISAESAFNPTAVSAKGARGLMQIMPATGTRYGAADLFDGRESVLTGARHLHELLTLYRGDLPLVLAAYNAGEGAVSHYRGQIPPYRETQNYVARVLASYGRYKAAAGNPEATASVTKR